MVGEPSTKEWLPSPFQVARAFYHALATPPVRGDQWLHQRLWHSCQIIFWGFVLSAIVGLPLGILCGTFDLFSKIHEPFIDFIRYMPAPAFGVLCMATLGINDGCKIGIIWIGTFFQMVLVVANTTRQFDESLLEAAQTLGATKRSLLTKVILPGILPSLYNDMRILIGWAWTYLIVAELIGASSGISEYIYREGEKYHNYDKAYAGIIMIGIIGLACDQILAAVSRWLFPWMPRSRGPGAWAAFFSALTFLPKWFAGKTSVVSTTPTAVEPKKEKPSSA
jgi:NitT/TauT family transport system permease protein